MLLHEDQQNTQLDVLQNLLKCLDCTVGFVSFWRRDFADKATMTDALEAFGQPENFRKELGNQKIGRRFSFGGKIG